MSMKTEVIKSASGVSARYSMFICTLSILLPVCLERYFITIVSCFQRRDSESTNILISSFMTFFSTFVKLRKKMHKQQNIYGATIE